MLRFFNGAAKNAALCSLLVPFILNAGANEAEENDPLDELTSSNIVMLTNPCYSFEATFSALILQPYANNIDYAAEALPFNYGDAQPAVSPSWVIPANRQNYHFGFVVGIAGFIHETNSTVMLNWERYHSPNDSNTTAVASTNYMIGPFFEIGPDASVYKVATGTMHFNFDEVNLDYGILVQFGDRLHANLFSGVSFAEIQQHNFTQFSNATDTVVRTIDVPSKFTGAGPQFGLDSSYTIFNGFKFVGKAVASLYVGTFKNSTTFSTTSEALVTLGDENPNIQTTTVRNKMGIVPGLEGQLGLAYKTCFYEHFMFNLGAGYLAQIYLNSIRSIDMGSEVALGDIGSVGSSVIGVYARTFKRTVSDFALGGPYITISLGF